MGKEQNKPLRNTYIFEIEVQQAMQGDVPSVSIVDRTYYVDSIGAEQLLISSYVYGSDKRIDSELDAARVNLDELFAEAHASGVEVTRIGLHKFVMSDARVRDELVAQYLKGFDGLRHFRVKCDGAQ